MSSSNSEKSCYFCTVVNGDADPFIYENQSFISIFDTNPVNPGHALVIPKRHVASIFSLNQAEHDDYFEALYSVRKVIEATDMKALYEEMLNRDYLKGRPKNHIETVLKLPFLGNQPDAYTLGNNDGREAGRSIDHLHIIVIPRYKGDVPNPGGGIRNIIPERAQYKRL